ncbi:putative reverse transcriptase domain-containing protein [Tanacetum coccineum]
MNLAKEVCFLRHVVNSDLEFGAIVFALRTWRHYLYGTKSVIYTDHKNLQHIFDQKKLNMLKRSWVLNFLVTTIVRFATIRERRTSSGGAFVGIREGNFKLEVGRIKNKDMKIKKKGQVVIVVRLEEFQTDKILDLFVSNYPAYSLVSCLQGLLNVRDRMGFSESIATTH